MDVEAGDSPAAGEDAPDSSLMIDNQLRFILDEPADEDFFQTHTAVARAITRTVVTNPLVRTIGILGRWGSGKSTVLRQFEKELRDQAPDGFCVFTYDAWLHQHDPVRRSFIEELKAFAMRHGWSPSAADDEQIKETLGEVRRSQEEVTPRLTPDAKALFLSLLPVPVGLALLRLDVIKGAFWDPTVPAAVLVFWLAIMCLVSPFAVAAITYGVRRPWRSLGRPFARPSWAKIKAFLRITDAEGRPGNLIPALINQSIKRTSTRTATLPEPTTIEFGRVFRTIIQGVGGADRRLVIVVDNLDRVPEDEALQIWATIRSFFTAPGSADLNDAKTEPLVLLPIDRDAIKRMFARSSQDDADALAESFLHKTFEVTFEVTQPVMSDWRDYLARQMVHAFGASLGDDWTFWTRKFFERRQSERKASPTPRQINRLVNRLLASFMQWGSADIVFPIQAYYIAFQEKIEADFTDFITASLPELEKITDTWQEQVAALYYGVEIRKAVQTLLDGPTRQAIQTGKFDDLMRYVEVPGFDDNLELVSSDLVELRDDSPDFDIVRRCTQLMAHLARPPSQAIEQVWRNVLGYYLSLERPRLGMPGSADAFQALADHVPQGLRSKFLLVGTDTIEANMLSASDGRSEAEIRHAALVLLAFCEEHGLDKPTFDLGDQGLRFIVWIAGASETPELVEALWSDVAAEDLDQALAEAIKDVGLASFAAQAFGVMMNWRKSPLLAEVDDPREEAWPQAFDTCSETIRDGAMSPQVRPAIDILLAGMRYVKGAQELVRRAAQDGTLSSRLAAAIDADEPDYIARYCAMLIWAETDFGSARPWPAIIADHPDLPKDITALLRTMHGPSTYMIIWTAYKTSASSRDLVAAMIEYGIAHHDLGALNPKYVMENLTFFMAPISFLSIGKFFDRIADYRTFWDGLPDVEVTDEFTEAAKQLAKGRTNRGKLEGVVRKKFDALTTDGWQTVIATGAQPFPLIEEVFAGRNLDLSKRSPLYLALEQTVPSLFTGDRALRRRWGALRTHLKAPSQRTLLDVVAKDLLGTHSPSETLAVLRFVEADIFKSSVWAKFPDLALVSVVMKLAASKPGRAWLKSHSAPIKTWTRQATPEGQSALKLMLDKMRARGGEQGYWAETCLNDWKL